MIILSLIYKETCSVGYVSMWGNTHPWQIVAVGRREKTPVNFQLFLMHIFASFIRNTLHLVIYIEREYIYYIYSIYIYIYNKTTSNINTKL